jgi:hypothetical protein
MVRHEQDKITLHHHSRQDKVRLETRVGTRATGRWQAKAGTLGLDSREVKEDLRILNSRVLNNIFKEDVKDWDSREVREDIKDSDSREVKGGSRGTDRLAVGQPQTITQLIWRFDATTAMVTITVQENAHFTRGRTPRSLWRLTDAEYVLLSTKVTAPCPDNGLHGASEVAQIKPVRTYRLVTGNKEATTVGH